ncbi:MAG: formylglycine-generating enzyme family protein, partial [Candidatus Latescibacterota bacterium]
LCTFDFTKTAVHADLPYPFILGQNYPNPFNPSTVIPFTLPYDGEVMLGIYNALGQQVRTLVNERLSAGSHTVMWNGRDDNGAGVGAGLYVYMLSAGKSRLSQKMLLLDGSNAGVSRNTSWSGKRLKPSADTYTITITGSDIERYEKTGVVLSDGNRYEYEVVRKRNNPGITFVSIPGGTFQMGDEVGDQRDECRPVHTVTVSGFDMGIYEVTCAQYADFLNKVLKSGDITVSNSSVIGAKVFRYQIYINLKGFKGDYDSYPPVCNWIEFSYDMFRAVAEHENWPVMVSWQGAKAFALYYGFDLPTEAEWEYACRGGKQYKYGTDDGTISSAKANYYKNGPGYPKDVGSYPKNPFGLYDMSGNVWEWCHDLKGSYTTESQTNPTGAKNDYSRVFRGGGWNCIEQSCRSAVRNWGAYPAPWLYFIGFRVVRRPCGLTY